MNAHTCTEEKKYVRVDVNLSSGGVFMINDSYVRFYKKPDNLGKHSCMRI